MGIWDDLMASTQASQPIVRTVFILGGTKEVQNDFIKQLYPVKKSILDSSEHNLIANDFFLGYTYIQFKDQSQDLLSTLHVYTLPDEFVQYLDIAYPLVIQATDKNDLLLISMFDYAGNPNRWLTQLRTLLIKSTSEVNQSESPAPQLLICVTNRLFTIDWDPEIHEYIQLCLRSLALLHNCSIIYADSGEKTGRLLKLVSFLLKLPTKINQGYHIDPVFSGRGDVLLLPSGADTWGKIRTLSDVVDPEKNANGWDLNNENNKFIENYQKIVPERKDQRDKVADGAEVLKNGEVENVPIKQFLQGLYEKRARKNTIASVLESQ